MRANQLKETAREIYAQLVARGLDGPGIISIIAALVHVATEELVVARQGKAI